MPEKLVNPPLRQEPEQKLGWPGLDDLAPHYVAELHGSYLRALVEGMEQGSATNIALSGSYGTGKSSILDGLLNRYRDQIVQISLATVRPVERTNAAVTDSSQEVPNEDQDSSVKPDVAVTANELQKEIVKQILYVVDPVKTPASRFPRVAKFRWGRASIGGLMAGFAGVAIHWLITVVVGLARGETAFEWAPVFYLPTFLATGAIVFLLFRLTNGRWAISDLTAGPAKLTLSDKKGSYFDDYLDEIVYFFQASKKRIVVLEDMDRFRNVEVFEDLRALNVLLNHAAQLKSSRVHVIRHFCQRRLGRPCRTTPFDPKNIKKTFFDGPIIFVYATRDSLLTTSLNTNEDVHFDTYGRTKFFDLIIPVVPFVTQQNARGALKKELGLLAGGKNHDATDSVLPSIDLVQSVAHYFPDQRQIRNIRNEFTIYREQLLQPGKHPAELTPDRLLGLVLYKNLEVADFEQIRLGKGQLYDLLKLSRKLITTNLLRINSRLTVPTEAALHLRAKEVGVRVRAQAAALSLKLQYEPVPGRSGQMTVPPMSDEVLSSLQLWRRVAAGEQVFYIDDKLFDRPRLEVAFLISLDFAEANPTFVDADEWQRLDTDREALEEANWAKLWAAPQFTLIESEVKGETFTHAISDDPKGLSFAQLVKIVLGEGLAADLIANGHLTQNFALLSASFDASFLGLEAQDFITRVRERSGRRPLDPISEASIAEIMSYEDEVILERDGMVNIHVLNYLLVENPGIAHRIVAQLRSWTEQDQAFLRDFMNRYGAEAPLGSLRERMAELTELAPAVVELLAMDASIPEARRLTLFDTAISHVRVNTLPSSTSTSSVTQQFVRMNQSRLLSLTQDDEAASRAAHCLIQLGVRIDDVTPLSARAREVLVPFGMFALTLPNLRELTDREPGSWVSLEDLRSNDDLYRSTLLRVAEYLDMTADVEIGHSASTPSGLVAVLTDLHETLSSTDDYMELLRRVAAHSDPAASVEDITQLDGVIQDALLFERRAFPTTDNLIGRLASAGEFTESLAQALHNDPRQNIDDDDAQDISALANQAVSAALEYPELLTADAISDFVDACGDHVTLEPSVVLAAEVSVAIRLIDEEQVNIATTRAMATTMPLTTAWEVREAVISTGPAPTVEELALLVQAGDVCAFIASSRISAGTKSLAPALLATFLAGTNLAANANAIADYLVSTPAGIDLDEVKLLAAAGAKRRTILTLLLREPAKTSLTVSAVTTLQALGGDYATLVDRSVGSSPIFPADAIHKEFLQYLAELNVVVIRSRDSVGRLRVKRLFPGL